MLIVVIFMEVVKINQNNIEKLRIDKIVKFLKDNKVVVLPTDTCYGIMAKATDEKAVRRVFKIKKRSLKKPLSCIFRDSKMIKRFVYVSKAEEKLIKKFLPGPLTIILKKKKNLLNTLTAGQKFIGVRIPKNKIIAEIMAKIKFPITATSANLSGKKEPYAPAEIFRQYKDKKLKPNFIVDAGRLQKIRPSTVVKLEKRKIRILRQGPISKRIFTNFSN